MDAGDRSSSDLAREDGPFTQAFYEIDADSDGVITKSDLEEFARKNSFPFNDNLVRSWMKLFEPTDSDPITMKIYKEKLGLSTDSKHQEKSSSSEGTESSQNESEDFRHRVRIISANMPEERQNEIIHEVFQLMTRAQLHKAGGSQGTSNSFGSSTKFNEAEMVADLKHWLESSYGRVWHVLIICGSYWMNYSHEIDSSLQFQLGSYVFVLWRTPAP